MRFKPVKFFIAFIVSFTLYLGVGTGHALVTSISMPDMGMHQMEMSQCQVNCAIQPSPIGSRKFSVVERKNTEPQPNEPAYLAFIVAGWVTVIALSATWLYRYLRWRPPDFIKLYGVYRF